MHCLKPGIKKGFLSDGEKYIIKNSKIKNIPPTIVSMNLTNRTPAQIRNAYRRIGLYDEDIYRGSWTADEDKMLFDAVNSNTPNEFTWTQISQLVPGRNAEQCRHRFKLIDKKFRRNPKLTIDDIPRTPRPFKPKKEQPFPEEGLNEKDLHEKFKYNRQMHKTSNVPMETAADRKLKKSYLENKFVIANCNLSSKCDLYRHVLDYLGAKLVVPETFAHTDDLIDNELMSMMTYISECQIELVTLDSSNEHDLCEPLLAYEGVHNVLRTSDITNSDLSEIEGLVDIRLRNIQKGLPNKGINTENSIKNKNDPLLPLNFIGSVPPNHETFKMLYTYTNALNASMKIDYFKDSNMQFDWDDEESKKLHKRLVAILRLPALFSSLIPYNTPNINMIVNTEEVNDINMAQLSNYSRIHDSHSKNKKSNFSLKNIL